MKLEHRAPYLPYKLKMKSPNGFRPNGKESTGVSGIVFMTGDLYADIENNTFKGEKFKLILHPLSDLTKEITHNGETFVPIYWLEERYYTLGLYKECERLLEEDGNMWINHMPYLLIIHLFEWHFDVFGLIEKGEAVDINTIDKIENYETRN